MIKSQPSFSKLQQKDKSMSQLSSTVSALLTITGLKIYWARLLDPNVKTAQGAVVVKTFMTLPEDSCVLIAHRNLFLAAEIQYLRDDYEIEDVEDFSWVISTLGENPVKGHAEIQTKLADVKKKIAQAQAMAAAKELLAASGVSADEFIALFKS